ncbi:MAG: molecular chaperone HtpG [Candidatus Sabulitectum sp.]|nr:molecular chaperone HtpG [Candidatus Sabulitectum sp.]
MSEQKTMKFKAETRRVLDLVIHSLYSNRDIFLRELVSNSSDAIDRLRYLALNSPDLLGEEYTPEIVISMDKETKTLTVSDNGIGMNADELESNLGTVASSGTVKFLEEAAGNAVSPELIGQFGVGFYSAFMVADTVTVTSRRAGEDSGWVWRSGNTEDYTIEPGEDIPTGTSITLQMKDDAEEYLDGWKIESLVKHYSDFVSNPVFLLKEETDDDGNTEEKKSQINTGTPVWLRSPSDVEDSEYNSFYSHLTHDHAEPMDRFWYHGEGTTEFYSLVYVPGSRGMDIMIPDRRPGLSLYARKVMIMERAENILPQYLHFLRGVVESPDVSLNVSREMLQQDRVLKTVHKVLTRKILDHFSEMMEQDREKYDKFFSLYGDFIKEGVYSDYERKEELASLLLFNTSKTDEMKALKDITEELPEDGTIFYLGGASLEELKRSPHLESAGDSDVILLHGPVDLLAVESLMEFKGRKFKNLASEISETDLSSEDKEVRDKAEKEHSSLIQSIKDILGEKVSGVRFSPKLRETPCILVSAQDDPGEMMKMMMRAMNQDAPEAKMILELNPAHPVIASLESFSGNGDSGDEFRRRVEMLLELAKVLSGSRPDDPTRFGKFVAELMG